MSSTADQRLAGGVIGVSDHSRGRLAPLVVGASLAMAVATGAALRGAGTLTGGRVVVPIAGALAVLLLVFSWGGAARITAAWTGVLLISQGAALQLVDAGTRLHYQHLVVPARLLEHPLEIALLGVQMLVVLAGALAYADELSSLARPLVGWRGAVLFGFLIVAGATLNRDVPAYLSELATSAILQLTTLLNLALLVLSVPGELAARVRAIAHRLLGGADPDAAPDAGGADAFAWTCATIVTVVSALLCVFVYQRHPHVQDEVKYLYQARYLADGVLALPTPPVPRAFELYLMDIGARGWYSVVPPGWAAVLAVGVKLGAAWLVNPVLSGVNVVLAYVLLRRLYSLRTARLATLLFCLSPMYLLLAMSFMAHAITLTCGLLAALSVERARRTGELWPTLLGGVAIGFCAIVRQLDGLILALVLGLWAIGLGGRRIRIAATAGLVLGTLIGVAPVLAYNRYFTGHAGQFPIMEYHDRLFGKNSNAYGFGPDRGMGWPLDPNPGHDAVDATINADLNTTALEVEMFGWAVGSLLVGAWFVMRGRLARADRAMLAVIGVTFVAYYFNYFSGGPDFGARYWFLMMLPIAVLTARGIDALWRDGTTEPAAARGESRTMLAAAILTLGSIALFLPWRSIDKYRGYLDMHPDARALVASGSLGRALVLVEGKEYPDYASAAIYNPLDLTANAPVFARDRDMDARRALLAAYPDRPVYILEGPSVTHAGYRMAAGPLTAQQAASAPLVHFPERRR